MQSTCGYLKQPQNQPKGKQKKRKTLILTLKENVHNKQTTNQPRPQGLLVQNGGQRNPWRRLPKCSKYSLKICHVNTMKCLRFVWTTVSDCRKQTGPPDTGNNLRKSHFSVCHVAKYSTILGVFQQPWPLRRRGEEILDEEKALRKRLTKKANPRYLKLLGGGGAPPKFDTLFQELLRFA